MPHILICNKRNVMICKKEIPNMDIYKALAAETRGRILDNLKEIKE